jgi:hypothetical protein
MNEHADVLAAKGYQEDAPEICPDTCKYECLGC